MMGIVGCASGEVYYINSTVLNSETTRYVIDQPGTYIFDEDVIDLEFPCDTSGDFDYFPLIWVRSSDVIIEGNGHVLDAIDQFNGDYQNEISAIVIGDYNGDPESAVYDNVTVRNLHLSDWSKGIAAYQNVGGIVEHNVIENCGIGVEIYSAVFLPSDLIVQMNTITSDGLDGPYGYDGIRVELLDFDDTLENPAIIIEKNQISHLGGGISVECYGIVVQVIGNTVTDCGTGIGSLSQTIILDNIITRCEDGIGLGWDEQEVINNTISQCQIGLNSGGYFQIIRDNIIEENSQYGILIDGEEYQIFNNYLNNTENVYFTGLEWWFPLDYWNTPEPIAEQNIVGGPSIGGNYWGTPDGTGYSQTATDQDGDGFADDPYIVVSGYWDMDYDETPEYYEGIDYFPLVHYSSPPEYGVYYLNSTVLNSETTRYVINKPGTYIFDEDIIDLEFPCDTSGDFQDGFPLIWVRSSDVIIEGNGHILDAIDRFDGSYNIDIRALVIGDYYNDPESVVCDNVTVRNLHISDWCEGISAYQNVGGIFEYNVIENCGIGVEISSAYFLPSDLIIRMNTITSDGLDGPYGYTEGIRVELNDFDDTLENPAIIIEKNQISHIEGGVSVQCSGIDVRIIGNVVTDCWYSGIGSDSKIIADNIVTRCGDGIGICWEEQEIVNNTISQCQTGLNTQGYGHIIRDNIIEENSQYGIVIDGEEYQIFNNYLNNTENINFAMIDWWYPLCIWNITEPIAEQNIVGGPSIGGNYWGTPDGTGYSQTATDQDGDGFADDPYIVVSGNWDMDYDGTPEYCEGIDYFPLILIDQTPENQVPLASFSFEPTSPSTADNVFFTDSSSDSDGTIAEYSWDFDGLGSSELQNPLFWFGSPGFYIVTLTVTDDDGASDSISQVVELTEPATGEFTLDIPGGVIEGDQLILDTTIAGTSVSYSGNEVTIQNNGLTITLTMTEPVLPPVDGIITGTVSSIQVESSPVTDGDYEAYFIAEMAALPTDATITSSLVQGPGSLETAFEAAAVDAGMEILDIASTFTITRTNIADDDSTGIIGAVISMKVPESWVIQVGGPEFVHIIRIPEEGEPEILDTTYISDGGYYTFSAYSENGLSVFGLAAMRPPDEISPIIGDILASPNPVPINTAFTLTATVDDSTTGNSNIATVQYSTDGSTWIAMTPVDGAFDEPVEEVTATLPQHTVADILSITIKATDVAGNTVVSEPTLLAIYDPTGAFITAGGWFTSPAGAYKADSTVTGKANLGLNSKYKKGTMIPTGETEFHLKEANLKFKATSYDWMVINGAKAIYRGSGTVNGAGNYGFLVSAISGDISGGQDLIRFKIWDKATNTVIFDNGAGSDSANPTTPLGGGNVKIHT